MGVGVEKAGRLAFSSLTSDRPSGPYKSRGGATQADFPLEAGELRTTSSSNLSQNDATREKTALSSRGWLEWTGTTRSAASVCSGVNQASMDAQESILAPLRPSRSRRRDPFERDLLSIKTALS